MAYKTNNGEAFIRIKRLRVMIDDLKPGKTMADNAGIDFIGAGWSHSIPKISSYMEKECKYYCKNVEELKKYIF